MEVTAEFRAKENEKELMNPFIGNPENGYIETQTGAEYWAEDASQIGRCFDWLSDQGTRELISARFRDAAYTLEQAQKDLKEFLCRFK